MARSSVQAERRRREIMGHLSREREVSTAQMARRLKVDPMTIRRDLRVLEESGAAVRSYGGAVAARRITFEFAFDDRHRRHLAEKRRIGAAAAEKMRAGQTVFLDTGTTTLEIARALAGTDVSCTVITSSLVIASELWGRGRIKLVLLGGSVRQGSPDLAGPATEVMLDRFTAEVAFLGSDGIDPSRGSFAGDVETARVAERMAANARRAVVVADRSKLGLAGPVRYIPIEEMDELITDRRANRTVVAALRRRSVTVTLV